MEGIPVRVQCIRSLITEPGTRIDMSAGLNLQLQLLPRFLQNQRSLGKLGRKMTGLRRIRGRRAPEINLRFKDYSIITCPWLILYLYRFSTTLATVIWIATAVMAIAAAFSPICRIKSNLGKDGGGNLNRKTWVIWNRDVWSLTRLECSRQPSRHAGGIVPQSLLQ